MRNDPVGTNGFLGRESELDELQELLEHRRLISLTGPPGIGKSRLGAEVARAASDRYPDGTSTVELAAVAAVSAWDRHTCVQLDDGSVRCWGYGGSGRLGVCSSQSIGDNEAPGSVVPIPLAAAAGGVNGCPLGALSAALPVRPRDVEGEGRRAEAARRQGMLSCLARVGRHARGELRRARGLSGSRRARAKRHIKRHRSQLRRRCVKRWGRTPGRVTGLRARPPSGTKIVLTFKASGSDGSRPPAARSYLVKQSRRPICSSRGFRRFALVRRSSKRLPAGGH